MSISNKSPILPVSFVLKSKKTQLFSRNKLKYIFLILILCFTINVYWSDPLSSFGTLRPEEHDSNGHDRSLVNKREINVEKPTVITHEHILEHQIQNYSCHYLTWTVSTEPFTPKYKRQNLTVDLNGPVLSSYQWDGHIDILDLNLNSNLNDTFILFKIQNNELYIANYVPSFNKYLVN